MIHQDVYTQAIKLIITILKLGPRKFQIGDNQDTCSVEDMYS